MIMAKFDELQKELPDIFYEMPEGNTLTDKDKQQIADIIKKTITDLK